MNSTNDLPDGWWKGSTSEVEALIRRLPADDPTVWPDAAGEHLKRLIDHHPMLLTVGFQHGFNVKSMVPIKGMTSVHPLLKSWAKVSPLTYALAHSPPSVVQVLLGNGASVTPAEKNTFCNLRLFALRLGTQGDLRVVDDGTLDPVRLETNRHRENHVLTVLATFGHSFNGLKPHRVFQTALSQRSDVPTFQRLLDDGVDMLNVGDSTLDRLTMVIAENRVDVLDWLIRRPFIGVAAIPQAARSMVRRMGPNDLTFHDLLATMVLDRRLKQTDETVEGWVNDQHAMLNVLHQQGWQPSALFMEHVVMHAVVSACDPSMVQHWVDQGARFDAVDKYGNTSLHRAFGGPLLVKNVDVLLTLGLDPQAVNKEGRSVMDDAQNLAINHPNGAAPAALMLLEKAVLRATLEATISSTDLPFRDPKRRL